MDGCGAAGGGQRRARLRLRRLSAHLSGPHGSAATPSVAGAAPPRHELSLSDELLPRRLAVRRLADAASGAPASFGVEVHGLQPAELRADTLPDELRGAFRTLLARHQVVVCRFEAALTVAQMQGVIALFGRVKHGWARCLDGSTRQYLPYDHPAITEELRGSGIMEHRSGLVLSPDKLKERHTGTTATGGTAERPFVYEGFHTDDSYTEEPAGITMLHARELPASGGGDTLFVDMAAAYRQLLEEDDGGEEGEEGASVAALRGRCAEHAYNNHNAFASRPSAAGANDVLVRPRHPILRRHPLDPSVVALYWDLDRATGHVDGCRDLAEGQRLLQRLQDRAEACAPRYSHVWREHDVLVWDNITVQHAASSGFKIGENR